MSTRPTWVLGFAVPDRDFSALMESDPSMPLQTQKFGWSLAHAIGQAGRRVALLSCVPAVSFPRNRTMIYRSRGFDTEAVDGRLTGFINMTLLKHVTRYFSSGRQASKLVKTSGAPEAILVHGANSALIWRAVALGRQWNAPAVVVLTDPYSIPTRFDGRLSLAFKKIDRQVILAGLSRCDGVVALTQPLADDFAPGRPVLVMEGLSSHDVAGGSGGEGRHADEDLRIRSHPPRVVYAGGLHEDYGIATLLRVSRLATGNWQMWFYGRGPMEGAIRKAAESNPRVVFGGLVERDQLSRIYGRAALLVNVRDPDAAFTKYSFPSKLIEYLESGTPVLSTRLKGIPEAYENVLLLSDADADAIVCAIEEALTMSPVARAERAARASELLASRSLEVQGVRLLEFMRSLADEHEGMDTGGAE